MPILSKRDVRCLGKTRAALFERLAASGRLMITSTSVDEFSQMSIEEVRQYVAGRERTMRLIRETLEAGKKVVLRTA